MRIPFLARNRAILFAVALGLWANPTLADDNSDANSLFVEAMLAWDQATGVSDDAERLRLLQLVDSNLQQIITDHSSADLAVKLVIGDSIGTLSIPAAREALAQAEAVAAEAQVWTNCIAAPTPLCILDEVRRQSLTAPQAAESYSLQAEAVRVLANARQFDAALELAGTFEIQAAQDTALRAIAIAQARAARVTDAHATADRIVGPQDEIRALVEIAKAEVAMLLDDQARASLNTATKLTGAITDEDRLRTTMDEIIEVMTELGLTDDALRIATAIADPDHRDEAITEIAIGQADDGPLDAALITIAMIVDPANIERVQPSIAVAQAKAGMADAALATAALITRPQIQAMTLAEIAAALSANGDSATAATTLDRATTIADAQTDPFLRVGAFDAIATEQADMGMTDAASQSFDTALAAAMDVATDNFGNFGYFTLAFLAESLSEAGMPDRAREVLEQARDLAISLPDDSSDKLSTLSFIAQTAAEMGQMDLANDIIRLAIETAMLAPDAYDRIANLSYIAVRMSVAGD